ncbi:hypothetical protein BHE74_00003094 [Ensete ventricosum]|nr:hypothetical protein BHE74_00003094 [Ensete ventricosum]RZR75725.1 hypothetical protein BHM03_00000205 [Ensete ventricosum]
MVGRGASAFFITNAPTTQKATIEVRISGGEAEAVAPRATKGSPGNGRPSPLSALFSRGSPSTRPVPSYLGRSKRRELRNQTDDAATAFRVFSPHRRHGDSGRSRTQKPEGSRSNRDSEEDQEGRSRTTRYGESEERRGEANKKKREQVESGRVARDPVSMFVNLFVFRAGKSWGFLRDGTPPGRSISRNFLIDHLIVHSPSQAGPHNSLPNHHAGT